MAKVCNSSGTVRRNSRCSSASKLRQVSTRNGKLTIEGPKRSRTVSSAADAREMTKPRAKKTTMKGESLRVVSRKHKQGCRTTGMARRPPKFSFVIDGLLAGQGRPTLPGHLQYICDLGFKYIVTLTLNKPRALNELPGELEWLHIPIQDETPPTVDQIRYFVSAVEKAKSEKTKIVAHCAWGRGRTGTMLACYLAKEHRLTASEAIDEIRRLRPGSVDTEKQEKAIEAYVNYLKTS